MLPYIGQVWDWTLSADRSYQISALELELTPAMRGRIITFKLSNDPQFEEKFWDVIGLYLDPPAKALVLCCDEKSQCQALERTQLGLPLAPKRPRTLTHDYKRHGTVTLFAALNVIEGKEIARTEERPPMPNGCGS